MGEIIGGIIVMGVFILFIMWKNKKGSKPRSAFRENEEQLYWEHKNSEEVEYASDDDDD